MQVRERQSDLLLSVLRDFLNRFRQVKLVLLATSTATIQLLTSYFTSSHILLCIARFLSISDFWVQLSFLALYRLCFRNELFIIFKLITVAAKNSTVKEYFLEDVLKLYAHALIFRFHSQFLQYEVLSSSFSN